MKVITLNKDVFLDKCEALYLKINKKPERLKVKSVTADQTLQAFLKQNRVTEKRMKEHAILNGLALDAQVKRGDLLKVIEL